MSIGRLALAALAAMFVATAGLMQPSAASLPRGDGDAWVGSATVAERGMHPSHSPSPVLRTLPFAGLAVALDAQTDRVFISDATLLGRIYVLDARTGDPLSIVHVGTIAGSLAVDAAAGHVFVAHNRAIGVLDGRTGRLLRTVHLVAYPTALAVSERTARVFALTVTPAGLAMIDARSGVVLQWQRDKAGDAIAVDEQTQRVFILNTSANRVSVFDARTGARLRVTSLGLPDPGASPAHLAVASAAGRVLVSGEYARSVLDARTGRLLHTIHDTRYSTVFAAGRFALAMYDYNASNGVNGVGILDPRSGVQLRMTDLDPVETEIPIDTAIDASSRRAYVITWTQIKKEDEWDGPVGITVLDALTGKVQSSMPVGTNTAQTVGPAIVVDDRTRRAFVLTGRVLVVDTNRL